MVGSRFVVARSAPQNINMIVYSTLLSCVNIFKKKKKKTKSGKKQVTKMYSNKKRPHSIHEVEVKGTKHEINKDGGYKVTF